VTNKEVSEQTYLEVRDIILKFKHQRAPVTDGITAEILRNVCPALWRRIRSLVEIMRNEEQIRLERKMGIECEMYKNSVRHKCNSYTGIMILICICKNIAKLNM
jgi:hypothetical protein